MYDVAVLGGGPGGYAAALRAATRGANVCCIEADRLGGTCLNAGCIPTKAMLHASGLLWEMSHAAAMGVLCDSPRVDRTSYLARVAKVVSDLRRGVGTLLKLRKVTVLRGRGRMLSAGDIEVAGDDATERVAAKSIIIATGAQPLRPGFLPWDDPRVMTTDEAACAATLPESVIIIGGGVIGCEFATIYSELGIAVTVVEMLSRLLCTLDADASRAVARSLKKRRVKVITGAKITGVSASRAAITATLDDGRTLRADRILAAVGRVPNVDGIGLETLGVEMDDGLIRVDDRCRTNVPNIYAVGDAAERRQYAHLATRMGLVAADNAVGLDASDDRKIVPAGVYTHPEVASVGLCEDRARRAHGAVKIGRFSLAASGMARACGAIDGMVKIIGDAGLAEIYGALVIGPHATDVVQEIALAMRSGLTVRELADTIHSHPTFAEAVNEAAGAFLGLPLHGGE